ncbi:MAG: Hsp20/alpha crystallin family protein [Methanoregulaceae archaeon]|jgi:HSP20 family protein
MKEDPDDVFGQMEKMMARMFAEMTREIPIGGMPPNVMGYRLIVQNGGLPQDEQSSSHVIQPRDLNEPVPEVHHIGDEIKVIAELPGSEKEKIHVDLKGSTLSIESEGRSQNYHMSTEIPSVDENSMQTSYRNGVLELTFKIQSKENKEK